MSEITINSGVQPKSVLQKTAKSAAIAAGISGTLNGAITAATCKQMLAQPDIFVPALNTAKEEMSNFSTSILKDVIDDVVERTPKAFKKITEKILTPSDKTISRSLSAYDDLLKMFQTGKVDYKYVGKAALKSAGSMALLVGGVALAVNTVKAIKANKANKVDNV